MGCPLYVGEGFTALERHDPRREVAHRSEPMEGSVGTTPCLLNAPSRAV